MNDQDIQRGNIFAGASLITKAVFPTGFVSIEMAAAKNWHVFILAIRAMEKYRTSVVSRDQFDDFRIQSAYLKLGFDSQYILSVIVTEPKINITDGLGHTLELNFRLDHDGIEITNFRVQNFFANALGFENQILIVICHSESILGPDIPMK
jgi:hypothetical protein